MPSREQKPAESPVVETTPAVPDVPGLPQGEAPAHAGLPASWQLPVAPPELSRETSADAVKATPSAQTTSATASVLAAPEAPHAGRPPEPEDNPRSLALTEDVAVGYGPKDDGRVMDAPVVPAAAQVEARPSEAGKTVVDPRLSVPLAAISERPAIKPVEKAVGVAQKQPEARIEPKAAAPAVAAVTAGNERIARLGDEVQVPLDGPSFLFLGYADKAKGEEGFKLKEREIQEKRTVFTFKALRLGSYDLSFSQQDNSTGKSRQEAVHVSVLSDPEYALAAKALPATPAETGPEGGEDAVRENADRLYGLGKHAAALAEYLKVNRDDDAFLIDRIAGIYAKLGDSANAVTYWKKNLSAAPSFREAAVYGIADAALARKDADLLLLYMKPLLDLKARDIGDLLIGMARFLEGAGEAEVSQDLLQQYLRRYPQGPLLDEAYFLLGRIFEGTSPLRDIRRSRESYQTVVQKYPESTLVLKARERIRYIDQHYLYVR